MVVVLVLLGCPSEDVQDDDSELADDDDSSPGDDDSSPGDDDSSPGDDDTGDDDDSAEEVILSEDTVLPENESYFVDVAVSGDELVFTSSGSGEDFGFEPGSVVVGCGGDCTDGEGYLRRVTSVEVDGPTATLQTADASLSEAIQNGDFDWQIPFESRAVVDLSGLELYADDDLSLSIANGTLSFDPTLHVNGTIESFTIDRFEATMSVDLGFDADVEAVATAGISHSAELTPPLYTSPTKVFFFWLGPVPVEGTIQVIVHAGYELALEGEASLTTGLDVEASLEVGAIYENGTWDNLWNPSLSGNYHTPAVAVSSNASVKVFVRPTVETRFYHAAGPGIGISPYLRGSAEIVPPPPTFALYAGVAGNIGVAVEVFSWELADYSAEFFDWNTLLYEFEFAEDLDGDGYYDFEDCDDEDSSSFPGATELCDDGADNDCDLDTDCFDLDCLYDVACQAVCSNGLDDDVDGWIDLDDPGCSGDANGTDEGGYDPSYACNDGVDNDGDGWVDADDPECGAAIGQEHQPTETACSDGLDDDGDGDIDCDDADCAGDPSCAASFVSVTAGSRHSCGLYSDGSVTCWGSDDHGQSSPPLASFTSLSAGAYHTCGITTGGSVECWGANENLATGMWYGQATPLPGTFVELSAGHYHTCGVRSDASVECWGSNENFDGTATFGQATPPAGSYSLIEAGQLHTCAIETTGDAVCWGSDTWAQATPWAYTYVDLASGYAHSCGLKSDQSITCWGCAATYNYGQCIFEPGPYDQIDAGFGHTCALLPSGTIECWGYDLSGQATAPGGTYLWVASGYNHNCAVATDGSMTCWGSDAWGQSSPP